MDYKKVLANAKETIGPNCYVCKACNGVACRGLIPGPGGKGSGIGFIRNYEDLKAIKVKMDTIYKSTAVDTSCEIFGHQYDLPVFAAPIGAVDIHYSDHYDDKSYALALTKGCHKHNILAFTGDGVDEEIFKGTLDAIEAVDGFGVPTIKPWSVDEVIRKIKMAEQVTTVAIAMDIDAAGLFLLEKLGKPVSPMSVEEIKTIANATELPFILKGIMTVEGAKKALDAGVDGIIVSNHGGRVLDDTPSTAEVLPAIADAVGDQLKILVDGGIRSGVDIFKMIALGADAVLIGRPFAYSIYGGDAAGVESYLDQLKEDFKNVLVMTNTKNIHEIDDSKLSG